MELYTVTDLNNGSKLITIFDSKSTVLSATTQLKEELSDNIESSVIIDAIFINGMGRKRFVDIDGNAVEVDGDVRKAADGIINGDTRKRFESMLRNKR